MKLSELKQICKKAEEFKFAKLMGVLHVTAYRETLTPALALELIGLIEQGKEFAEYILTYKPVDRDGNYDEINNPEMAQSRSFLEALRTWEEKS